jgi:hypothetical protein
MWLRLQTWVVSAPEANLQGKSSMCVGQGSFRSAPKFPHYSLSQPSTLTETLKRTNNPHRPYISVRVSAAYLHGSLALWMGR